MSTFEELRKSVNQQNHVCVKEPLRVQDRPKDFNRRKHRAFTDSVSDSTLQLLLT